ncbi:helix-turn-helix transcriptional regulator [Enterococcus faecium]|uniref:helix-turn-helix domain-containing protein n=1 Tax=Enterococcus TaxID=1350 RepID=UPI0010C162D7|nr:MULTISPECIES: helix-turn-helix transcriptional regulator [Enterococcus]EGP5691065.1 XRE family transcriptional regulator [Enterococcus faecium]EME8252233.1 helix-turn-helix transcriptional regulator [Enterococcus faecium]EMF0266746.1 helix-turn-helix transcriptional regulator [Enterococcus faecium]EMF0397742.1 helix-turn-helix transcriptional regulator [Enterococcus faecium]EMF0633018.1 helix-turn-helix transcriptional regulator [Enterococcus faecium]
MKQKQYAKVIREKRKALGWTQKELAEKIFSTQQAVARWENSVTEPNLYSLTALSRALGTPVSHFLDNVVVDYEEEFLALYRSLSTEDAVRTIDYMKLLKRQENERNQLLKD